MCGIVGILHNGGEGTPDRQVLETMMNAIAHRGPDEGGTYVQGPVALGHRRLSIIDLASGQQPLYNEDGSVVVVYNGEIYNYKALARELQEAGHQFRTNCDTEVVVHAWEEWGSSCIERFNGFFAFAIWDRGRQILFLARDRLGIKPLYYASTRRGTLLFASELKGLLACPTFPRHLDVQAIEDYFAYGYVPDPKTIFSHARKLPPGHTLTVKAGYPEPQLRRYWDVAFDSASHRPLVEVKDELILRLREAVDMRLMSEVPLGAFLSGGVDSSSIVAMMAELSDSAVNTCCISFGDPAYNEARFAALVAERYQTNHYVEQVDPEDFDLIDILAKIYDEPFADSSAIPTYRVCELARQRVTVALSGDGGDENFAGYRRYRWHVYEEKVRSLLPQGLRRPLFGMLGALYPKADWAPRFLRAKSTFHALARDSLEGYLYSVSVIPDGIRRRLFSKKLNEELQGYRAIEVLRGHAANMMVNDPLSQVQYLDIKTYLPADILTKVDRASMAHSLEVRVPILDHTLVEWAARQSPDIKLNGREGKFFFKAALEPYLPQDILYREKMGFTVPISSWFRGPLRQRVRDAVLGPRLAETGYFDTRFLKTLLDQHQSGIREHSASLWAVLMFEAFHREVLEA
jgi:asparagine synthase (glutamine-hydrolysing)